ncbi:sulfatase [Flavobacterium ammoniigenes]|jgi:phosphoglycerol transferase MdoB-like AlkP superfamily enzyme|uniref:Sulfatase n=1 Tax=Flavobacterium ammoniigenes TaxID=1751095 RepID=A0ABM7V643_9FLAO|nr:alkaline phosphatase family protein [Flavobacterium ammoniigenes]BDB55015.1 sulfatase [Flavobacterium ammoniigenes]
MKRFPRFEEYKVVFYRILLAYVFYTIARLLFFFYNRNLIQIDGVTDIVSMCYHGLTFDTASILYLNLLFIVFSILPLRINHSKKYQGFLFYLYFILNLLGYATNYVDFIYYRFNFGRSTIAALDSLKHESNKSLLLINFLFHYWHVFVLFFVVSYAWIYLYKKVSLQNESSHKGITYFGTSVVSFLVIVTLIIGGIRGDFKKSTRPINLIDASRDVKNVSQADVVLNTPFALIRTLFSNNFKKMHFVDETTINTLVQPIKQYKNNPKSKPNVVIFILESNAKEYFGSFNKNTKIPNYKGYTPFVDSLAQHSLIFTNAYANGYKSIHAMSSVLAGIPSFKDAFTSSPYPKQKTESLVSTLKSEGYATSFFHGAPNGSMGFLGYANILGFDHYYGKNEYNNDDDFDGVWGIWDEPFFQYFNTTISKEKQPFMATLFSVTSHEPYQVPEKYKGKFPKGDVNIHQCIGYTDFALQQFFASAKKQPWFKNTIFVFVGDHGNTIFYDEYKKEMNKNVVAMMIYKPNSNLNGESTTYAQQIDLYPTILDLIGYEKPFRSWGRSLVGDKQIQPFVIRYSSNLYQFMSGNYSCTFDGNKVIGFYAKNDKDLKYNLIAKRNPEMNQIELKCKAYLQDYMARVMDKKLAEH